MRSCATLAIRNHSAWLPTRPEGAVASPPNRGLVRQSWRADPEAYYTGIVWVFGLVLCEVPLLEFLGAPPTPDQAYYLHWLEFLCVGLLTPLVFAAVPFVRFKSATQRELLRDAGIAYVGLWIVRFILVGAHGSAVGLFGFECLILVATGAFRGLHWRDRIALLALSLVAWTVMMPQGVEFEPRPLLFAAPVTPAQLIFLVISAICAVTFSRTRQIRTTGNVRILYLAGTLVIAAFLAFRVENNIIAYNYGFFIGPAEVIRQGGWLLWDVPSQYGYLNVLLIALLPFK
jgi:hypothetical protein